MEEDLIEFEDLQECSPESLAFSGVTFKRDFGPWKKGDKAGFISFELEKSAIKEVDDTGTVVKSCKFTLQPVLE